MGSSFSVYNDTDKPIWVSHGVCKAALFGTIGGVLAVATAGAGAAAFAAAGAGTAAATAGAGAGGVLVATAEGVVMMPAVAGVTLTAATYGGITAAGWTALGTVSGLLAAGSGITAGLVGEEKEKVMAAKKALEEKLEDYDLINPGERYTVSGTLALVLTAYVLYDDGKEATHDCWTGGTDGSNNEYNVSEYF